jgi:hypothetical protein
MARTDDDARELRGRQLRLRATLDNLAPVLSDGHDDGVGITLAAAAVGAYVAIQPATISGPETEGATPTIVADPAAVPISALCLGPNVPAPGTKLVYSVSPEGRYVFNY